MIIIFVEKPLMSRRLLPLFTDSVEPVVFIHTFYFTNIYFNYPDRVKWADYPYLQEPEYRIRDWSSWFPQLVVAHSLEATTLTTKMIQNASKVIYAGDPCSESAYTFSIFARDILKKPVETNDYPAMVLFSLDDKAISKAYEERQNFILYFKDALKHGAVKRYFDYQFNTNSLGIFGSILHGIGIDNTKYQISKYSLLLLYILTQQNPLKEGMVISLMSKWNGTGKYSGKGFASVTSRLQILENLVNMGLVGEKQKLYFVTENGKELIFLLHKDCYDPDLSFRISEWGSLPLEEAKEKINRYINTFFGKQKKKLNLYHNKITS